MISNSVRFDDVGRLPHPDDNVAVAVRRLDAGLVVEKGGNSFTLSHGILEGHRFAVATISSGQALLSWGRSFGKATRDIAPGEYVANQGMLDSMSQRHLDFPLPAQPNFAENLLPVVFDEKTWTPVEQVSPHPESRSFLGYARPGSRGVGVRNLVVLLGVNARVASFVRQLEARLKKEIAGLPNLDDVVAIAHTEGDQPDPNNLDFVLRTLGGYVVHPNTAAVLLVDAGPTDAVHARRLLDWMKTKNYALTDVPHSVFSVESDWDSSLEGAAKAGRAFFADANRIGRMPAPLGAIKIALQCGGSDAFSGISANPLIGVAAREFIRYGGAANIAETDELIGAEEYMIARTRTPEVASRFLEIVDSFRQRAGWHGASAEGNPTGGNKYRGLYNINLKSIGAAMKKPPEVRLDHAIEHAELMKEPGYYFMDSPGNDLESIAGQVACGCQIIYFTTGNGSITNHPLAPTIKVVTTTRRFELLSKDMDVNAGAYLDGTPMEELGRQLVDLTVEVCSGRRTVGEKAGHSQVQLWRNWRRSGPGGSSKPSSPVRLAGTPFPIRLEGAPNLRLSFPLRSHGHGPAAESLGLIMPTSLCAGSIAKMAAARLTEALGGRGGISRYLALPHTEGCCVSQNEERLYQRTVLGSVAHPSVACCLMLEHGCEVTHNDYMREDLGKAGLSADHFGWASIQLDGGIDKVLARVEDWVTHRLQTHPAPAPAVGGLGDLRLGLATSGPIPEETALDLARVCQAIVGAGGTVVLPDGPGLLRSPIFIQILGLDSATPTVAYAQPITQPGLHIMATPTLQWTEVLVGLASCGVQAVLAHMGVRSLNGTPLVPVIQFTANPLVEQKYARDLDFCLPEDGADGPARLLREVERILSGAIPSSRRLGNEVFQVSRGELAVTL